MLEVHPPHHTASSWRDFFIYIATIVIGRGHSRESANRLLMSPTIFLS